MPSPADAPAERDTADGPGHPSAFSALLLLTDGRFPSGGHAHSGGLEATAATYGLCDTSGLEAFLRGRLATAGLVGAAFAAAACSAFRAYAVAGTSAVFEAAELDRELDARTPSSAVRATSRRLGRQLLRVGRITWPHPGLDDLAKNQERSPHLPIALGAVAGSAGLDPAAAALAAAHESVVGPATAAVRLLGLDPFGVHAALARLGPQIDDTAARGARSAGGTAADLPACAGPLLDILAEHHATWEVRLFAS